MELPEGYIFKAPCVFWREKSLLLYASGSVLYAFNTRDSVLSHKFENGHITKAIRSITVDNARSLILVASEDKILSIFDDSIKLLAKRQFGKKLVSTAVVENSILIADSFGDISVLPFADIHDIEDKGSDKDLLCPFSHYSTITATYTSAEGSIFTANKDGKVVRNSIPDVHNILNYYLGHTQSVSSLAIIDGDIEPVLASLSIDFSVKFWDIKSGDELYSVDLTQVLDDVGVVPCHIAWDSANKILLLPCSKKLFFLHLSLENGVSHVNTTTLSLEYTLQTCLAVPLEDSSQLYIVDSEGNLHIYISSLKNLDTSCKLVNDVNINLWEKDLVSSSLENSKAIPLNVAKHVM
ncbi:conserved hypothetical protein [Theileria equi strain WA]|uniref:Uncharacterized protein n=1 Tax=Theileria equi strain WA TaxID=1537102 RepID=L1LE94_THEEQ|nr:conserved hypothetical protein [Theileria equi strain WA]EKX73570.1 conserved hypothetical protein [Theileria equi strain WA]|eukprot:XP_004833022.1 conserved hypothetical protein [Theileria equi strain WA]